MRRSASLPDIAVALVRDNGGSRHLTELAVGVGDFCAVSLIDLGKQNNKFLLSVGVFKEIK
jgi:hypothetical protein